MFSSFDSTKAVIGIIALGRKLLFVADKTQGKMWTGLFFGLFFDRF